MCDCTNESTRAAHGPASSAVAVRRHGSQLDLQCMLADKEGTVMHGLASALPLILVCKCSLPCSSAKSRAMHATAHRA